MKLLKILNNYDENNYRSMSIDINNFTVDDDVLGEFYEKFEDLVYSYLDGNQLVCIV